MAEHEIHVASLCSGIWKQNKCRGENIISQWQALHWDKQTACFLQWMHGKSIPSPLQRLLNMNQIPSGST